MVGCEVTEYGRVMRMLLEEEELMQYLYGVGNGGCQELGGDCVLRSGVECNQERNGHLHK